MSNAEAHRIFGVTPEQIAGKTVVEFTWNYERVVHEDLTVMEVDDYPVMKVIKTKEVLKDYIVGIQLPDRDHITWVNANAVPVVSSDGELEKVIVNFVDITARKQAEEKLKQARNYIANIINSMPSVLVGVDPDGTVTQWNTEAERVTGVGVTDAGAAAGEGLSTAGSRDGSGPRVHSNAGSALRSQKSTPGEWGDPV